MTVYKKIDLKCTQFCGALSALLNFEKDVFFFTNIEILRTTPVWLWNCAFQPCFILAICLAKLMMVLQNLSKVIWPCITPRTCVCVIKKRLNSNFYASPNFVMCYVIWYHLYTLKNVNTHWGVLKVTLLHDCFLRILNCTNGTKSRKTSQCFLIFQHQVTLC